MKLPFLIAVAALTVVSAQTLTLGWNPCTGAERYRVFAGPTSRGWDTNWTTTTNATTFALPELGRWFFVVRAERGETDSNFAASAMSEEVSFELLPAPQISSEPYVILTTLFEGSTNLADWHSHTSTATWLPATNEMKFYRNPKLKLEAVRKP
jgi:hypothetical protein